MEERIEEFEASFVFTESDQTKMGVIAIAAAMADMGWHAMSIAASASADDGSKGGFQGNYDGLLRFMEIGPMNSDYDDKLRALYAGLPGEPARGYKVAMNDSRTFDLQNGFGESPTYLTMLRGTETGSVVV